MDDEETGGHAAKTAFALVNPPHGDVVRARDETTEEQRMYVRLPGPHEDEPRVATQRDGVLVSTPVEVWSEDQWVPMNLYLTIVDAFEVQDMLRTAIFPRQDDTAPLPPLQGVELPAPADGQR